MSGFPVEEPIWPVEGPVWLVGAGNMAGAMLRRWLGCGLDPARVTIIRKSGASFADGVRVLTAPPVDGPAPALAMLGVKPQTIDEVAPWLAPALGEGTLLVSILAGVEIATLRDRFPAPAAVLRAMPNTPVALGRGVTGLTGDGLADAQRRSATSLMELLGLVAWTDEPSLDIVAALAGSGPAFLFRFVDALADAGADAGLPADLAARMALATVAGAAALAQASDESPRELAARVTSKGGSTRAGLDMLDGPSGLAALMRDTLNAAILRNREMAAAARR